MGNYIIKYLNHLNNYICCDKHRTFNIPFELKQTLIFSLSGREFHAESLPNNKAKYNLPFEEMANKISMNFGWKRTDISN